MPGLLLIGSFPAAHKVYHPGSHLAVVSVGWSADAWAVTLCPKKPALPGEVSDALTLRSSNIPGFVVLTEIHSEPSGKNQLMALNCC